MNDVKFDPGLYFEGGIYIFQGIYYAGRLEVNRISLPRLKKIAEPSSFFPTTIWPNSDDRIVFMSDVFLDDSRVWECVVFKILLYLIITQ